MARKAEMKLNGKATSMLKVSEVNQILKDLINCQQEKADLLLTNDGLRMQRNNLKRKLNSKNNFILIILGLLTSLSCAMTYLAVNLIQM